MRQNKLFSVLIMLCMISVFTMSWKSISKAKATRTPVTITAVYDFSTFPNVVGTFTTTGLNGLSGASTMYVDAKGIRAHCDVVLYPSGGGTILIDQECEFAGGISAAPWRGRWQIVGGNGSYANLKGNGSLTMPESTEAMTGFIY